MPLDAAVLLAGGRSARMGTEKALLELSPPAPPRGHAGGRTLIERALETLAPRFERLWVSVASDGPSSGVLAAIERASRAAGKEIGLIRDRVPAGGPLEALATSLEEIDTTYAFFIAVDIPGLSMPLAGALWEAATAPARTGSIPRWAGGLEPAHAVYCKCLFPGVRRLIEEGLRRLQSVATLPGVGVLDLTDPRTVEGAFGTASPDLAKVFRNLNSPEEYRAWREEGG